MYYKFWIETFGSVYHTMVIYEIILISNDIHLKEGMVRNVFLLNTISSTIKNSISAGRYDKHYTAI